MTERTGNGPEEQLAFEKEEVEPQLMHYEFPNVSIGVDTRGKNQKDLPELLFGTMDVESGKVSMNMPEESAEGVDMEYVTRCLRAVAQDSGVREFWMFPYGGDAEEDLPETEQLQKRRSGARLRLFKRFWNVEPSPTGKGYIVRI